MHDHVFVVPTHMVFIDGRVCRDDQLGTGRCKHPRPSSTPPPPLRGGRPTGQGRGDAGTNPSHQRCCAATLRVRWDARRRIPAHLHSAPPNRGWHPNSPAIWAEGQHAHPSFHLSLNNAMDTLCVETVVSTCLARDCPPAVCLARCWCFPRQDIPGPGGSY